MEGAPKKLCEAVPDIKRTSEEGTGGPETQGHREVKPPGQKETEGRGRRLEKGNWTRMIRRAREPNFAVSIESGVELTRLAIRKQRFS